MRACVLNGFLWSGLLAGMCLVAAGSAVAQPMTGGGPGGFERADGASSLFLWLRAESLLYDDGDPIVQWLDSSGYHNHANQGFGGASGEQTDRPPMFRADRFSGYPAAEFRRDEDPNPDMYGRFLLTTVMRPPDDGSESIFVVKATRRNDISSQGLVCTESPVNIGGLFDHGGVFQWYASGATDGDGAMRNIPGSHTNGPQIVSGVRSTNDNVIALYTDGTLQKSTTHSESATSGRYLVGAAGRGVHGHNHSYDGEVAEVIVFTRMLNAAERILVENHLSAKYAHPLDVGKRYAGDSPANGTFSLDVFGVGRVNAGNVVTNSGSAGFAVTVSGEALDDEEWILAGHRLPANRLLVDSTLPGGLLARWERVWHLDKTGSMDATLSFGFSDGGIAFPDNATTFALLYRADDQSAFTDLGIAAQVNGDMVSFAVPDATLADGQYALGTDGFPVYTVITGGAGPGGVGRTDGDSTLSLWLRPEVLADVYADGAAVTNWFDSSGWDNDAVQVLGGDEYRPPTLRADRYKGRAAVDFQRDEYGGNNYGDFLRTDKLFASTAETYFFVSDPRTPFDLGSDTYTRYMLGYGSYSQRGFYEQNSALIHWTTDDTTSGSGAIRGGGQAISTNLQIKSAMRSVAQDFMSVYLDGQHSRTVTHSNGTLVPTYYQVGAAHRGGHNHINAYDGHIAEIIVFTTNITHAQRILVENYLNAKYMSEPLAQNNLYSGDTADKGHYDQDVFGIGRTANGDSAVPAAGSAGFGLTTLAQMTPGHWVLAGRRTANNAWVPAEAISSGQRWSRVWYVERTGTIGARMSFGFDDAGIDPLGGVKDWFLLYSPGNAFEWERMDADPIVNGTTISFDVPSAQLESGYYTIGFAGHGTLILLR